MLNGLSNAFPPSNSKPAENENEQDQPHMQDETSAAPSHDNSTGSQNSGVNNAGQAQAVSRQSASAPTALVDAEGDKGASSFNEAAYIRRVAERVQAEIALNSVFNPKEKSSAVPSLFAAAAQETEPSNKAVLKEYLKNSEPA